MEIFTGDDCNFKNKRSEFPKETPPAMAYIPFQEWAETYDASKGFGQGTIFPVLDKPFTGKRGDFE